ncbi:MAG: 6-bladed beta-propeller [Parabacteroides sp.]|nr:6-bladed beta-propeller [Parabacteroides sp.]
MKSLLPVLFLSFVCACNQTGDKTNKLSVVDVAKDYQPKEICLQDIADVEYLPIATSDSMLVSNSYGSVSDEGIAIRGAKVGEILLFDRQGQKLQGRISKRGQGPEEYNSIVYSIVDWQRKEVFIADYTSMKVYDFSGKYLRTLINTDIMKIHVCDFNPDYLLCSYDKEGSEEPYHPYFVMSKDNGTTDTLSIEILRFIASNRKIVWDDGHTSDAYGFLPHIFRCTDKIWLTNVALDTIFAIHPDQTLEPVMIPLHAPTTDEEAPLLFFRGMNDRYAWVSRAPRHVKVKLSDMAANLEKEEKLYMYDRNTNEWFEPLYRNRDINNRDMSPKFINISAAPYGYGLIQLNAMDLVEAYGKNQIVDEKLKKFASRLQEEDNPVLMILKFKK